MNLKEIRFKKILQESDITAAIISSPENFYYLTGFTSHQHTVSRFADFSTAIVSSNDTFKTKVILMDFEKETIEQKSNLDLDIYAYDTWVGVRTIEQMKNPSTSKSENLKINLFDRITSILKDNELLDKKIGIEMDFISINFYNKLIQAFPKIQFVNISPLLIISRSIKTKDEINIFRKLVEVQDKAMNYTKDFVKVGVSEKEISDIYHMKVIESNYCMPSSWSMFASGANCSRLGLPSDKLIEDGDVFKYDGGVNLGFSFYTTDFARSYIIGKKDKTLVDIKQRLYDAQRLMLKSVKPGMLFNELFQIGFEHVSSKYTFYERGHLGHSISMGPQTAEYPFINKTNTAKIEENMILTIEVPLYIKGIGGFNIEDMILITKEGCEVLSHRTPHFIESEL